MKTLTETLTAIVHDRHGFLTPDDVTALTQLDRIRQLLVRCGTKRFVCAAQDVNDIIASVEAGGDYVRDVSLPSTDPAHRGNLQPRTFEGGVLPDVPAPKTIPKAGRSPFPAHCEFRDEDYSGAFDGFGVTPDADPGL